MHKRKLQSIYISCACVCASVILEGTSSADFGLFLITLHPDFPRQTPKVHFDLTWQQSDSTTRN